MKTESPKFTSFRRSIRDRLEDMGYILLEISVTKDKNEWAFGFARDDKKCYGFVAFVSTGQLGIEVLESKETQSFSYEN